MNLLNSFILLIISGLLLTGCVTSSTQPVDIKIKKLILTKITPFGQSVKLSIDIQNKSSQPIYLRTLDYKLSLNGVQISEGEESLWRTIPAFSTYSFSIDVVANVWEQFKPVIATIKDTREINYYFTGELMTGNIMFQERVYIQQADTLTMNDLPLKKIQKLQHLIPNLGL